MFKFTQTVNRARQSQGVVNNNFAEKWVDDQLYAFTRGKFFVAVTNQVYGQVHADVPNTGFTEGQIVCNIFYPTDCPTIKNGVLGVYLNNGEVKIFIPKTSEYWTTYAADVEEQIAKIQA